MFYKKSVEEYIDNFLNKALLNIFVIIRNLFMLKIKPQKSLKNMEKTKIYLYKSKFLDIC